MASTIYRWAIRPRSAWRWRRAPACWRRAPSRPCAAPWAAGALAVLVGAGRARRRRRQARARLRGAAWAPPRCRGAAACARPRRVGHLAAGTTYEQYVAGARPTSPCWCASCVGSGDRGALHRGRELHAAPAAPHRRRALPTPRPVGARARSVPPAAARARRAALWFGDKPSLPPARPLAERHRVSSCQPARETDGAQPRGRGARRARARLSSTQRRAARASALRGRARRAARRRRGGDQSGGHPRASGRRPGALALVNSHAAREPDRCSRASTPRRYRLVSAISTAPSTTSRRPTRAPPSAPAPLVGLGRVGRRRAAIARRALAMLKARRAIGRRPRRSRSPRAGQGARSMKRTFVPDRALALGCATPTEPRSSTRRVGGHHRARPSPPTPASRAPDGDAATPSKTRRARRRSPALLGRQLADRRAAAPAKAGKNADGTTTRELTVDLPAPGWALRARAAAAGGAALPGPARACWRRTPNGARGNAAPWSVQDALRWCSRRPCRCCRRRLPKMEGGRFARLRAEAEEAARNGTIRCCRLGCYVRDAAADQSRGRSNAVLRAAGATTVTVCGTWSSADEDGLREDAALGVGLLDASSPMAYAAVRKSTFRSSA